MNKYQSKFFIIVLFAFQIVCANEMNLGRYWIEDRFIRAISLSTTDSEKLDAFNSFLQAVEEFKKIAPRPVIVSSLEELDKIRYDYLHPNESSEDEIAKFKSGFIPEKISVTSNIPEVSQRISEANSAYQRLIDYEFDFPPKNFKTTFLKLFGLISNRKVGVFELIFENSRDSDMTISALKKMNPNEMLLYLRKFHEQIYNLFNVVRESGNSVLSINDFKLKDHRANHFLKLVVSKYFTSLPDEAIWNFIFLQLENPEKVSTFERFKLFSRNVGPHFHKLFQIFAKRPEVSKELAEVFESFEEALPEAPKTLSNKAIRDSKFKHFEILSFDEKPIQVGSMAQIHRARVRFYLDNSERFVAIRILKPGIKKWVDRDNEFLDKLIHVISNDTLLKDAAQGVDYKQILSELKLLVMEEMDIPKTIHNQNVAKIDLSEKSFLTSSNRKVNISIPTAFASNNESVMAMEWVNGLSYTEFVRTNPIEGKDISENIFKIWVESVLFDGGFLHADLHPGNLKVENDLHSNNLKLHVLDFGMSGTLSSSQQGAFMLLAAATSVNNYRLISRSIWEMSYEKPNLTMDDFEKILYETFHDNTVRMTSENVIFLAIKNGFNFDTNFIKLVRGFSAINSLLIFSNSEKKSKDLLLEIFRQNPKQVLKAFTSLKSVTTEDTFGILKSIGLNIKDLILNIDPKDLLTKSQEVIGKGHDALNKGKNLFGKLGGFIQRTADNLLNEQPQIKHNIQCLKSYKSE